MYKYTYDAVDNLTTKVTPFEDDFNDGEETGWTTSGGPTFTGFEMRSDTDAAVELMGSVQLLPVLPEDRPEDCEKEYNDDAT